MWHRPQVVGPCSQSFSCRICIKRCDRVRSYFLTSCVILQARDCIGNAWDLLPAFFLSCRDVVALLTPGGAIPARRYTFSTEVGLRHPVTERHASFRDESSLLTCVDLSHTGHAHSAVE